MTATPRAEFISTDLGRLHVRRSGTGPPAVLWHSLFVDSQSWGPLVDTLARHRTVHTIDGPSHGQSEAVPRDFTFDECQAAAEQALDRLGLFEPVDCVGQRVGRASRYPSGRFPEAAAEDPGDHRHPRAGIQPGREVDKGLAAGAPLSLARPHRVHQQDTFRLPVGPRNSHS